MVRQAKHESYGPGKFEGEACYTRLAHYWIGEGMGDFVDDGEEGGNTQRLAGPFTLQEIEEYERETGDSLCQECLSDLLQADAILDWEDSQGFAYATLE